jgi:hypothetical protein
MGTLPFAVAKPPGERQYCRRSGSFKGFLQEGKEFRSILEEEFPPELLVLLLPALWGHDYQSWQCWQCWQFGARLRWSREL